MKCFFVYILLSLKDNRRYVGCTSDLERRMAEHSRGSVKSTRNRRPLKLVYVEKFDSLDSAYEREKFYKTGKGREALRVIGL